MEITNLTEKRIIEYFDKGKRFDKRSFLEYRPISFEVGVSEKAEGSATVEIGKTKVIAGVKLDLAEPYPDSQDEGGLIVTAELLPMASEKFHPGPPSIEAIEIARVIDRGIRESGFIDLKKLCIKEGEKVWAVLLDIYIINDDGNLIDAAALASIAALKTAVFPKLKGEKGEEKVEYGSLTTKSLPLTDSMPLTLTFYKIGHSIILDPTTEEEEASESRISIAVSDEQAINAIQKGGSVALTKEEIYDIIDLAVKEREKLYSLFTEKLDAAVKALEENKK